MEIEGMSVQQILTTAIGTEIWGRNFYNQLAQQVKHPEVKKKIISLAEDETRHREIVENLYRQVVGGEPPHVSSDAADEIMTAISDIKVDDKTHILDLLDKAINAEAISAKFYRQGAALVETPEAAKIFQKLENEEDGHYNYLMAERSALLGDLYWFSIPEAGMMEE